MTLKNLSRLALLLTLGVGLAACDKASAPSGEPVSEGEPLEAPATRGASQPASAAAGEASPSGQRAPTAAPGKVGRKQLGAAIRGFITKLDKREQAFIERYDKDFKDSLANIGWFKKLSTRAYEDNGHKLIFIEGEGLAEHGRLLLEAVEGVEAHGIDPEWYRRDELEAKVEAADKAKKTYEEALVASKDDKVVALWQTLDEVRGIIGLTEAALLQILERRDLRDADEPLLGAVDKRMDRIFTAKRQLNDALRDLDFALLQSWFRLSFDMRFRRWAHPFDAHKTYGKGVEANADKLYDYYAQADLKDMKTALAALEPKFPEYRQMMKGLAFYRELAETYPEHIELPSRADNLKPGHKGDHVKKLQTRLKQEGYFEGEVDGKYGDALAKAVQLYQETHQLKDKDGKMDRATRRSLNKSYARRAEQIELGLARHRESQLHQGPYRFGDYPVQARVNIPAFEATFFKDGVAARKHRVVVGNNAIETDEETGLRGWFNRTRMFSREMRTIVLNPTWKVPSRIKEQELDRELLEEPDYYEKNGYAVRILDDGSEEVVQLPGPNNALGLVKFLFPNQFAIYMHDTPRKRLFKRPIRAFSHGCMRTENPLDLARWILVDNEGMSPERFDKILKSREEYGIALETKIPITIEYNTVGVHESGRMMFYIDIYRYDRDLADGKTPHPPTGRRNLEQVVLK